MAVHKPKITSISLEDARKITLCAGVGLHKPEKLRSAGVAELVKRLGFVQIDTISVVDRAHHHILGARVPGYQKTWLAQASDQIFEYWAHAAAYLPWDDYRYTLPRKVRIRQRGHDWFTHEAKTVEHVLQRIKAEGPLMARDFESEKRNGTWWDWKPAKRALEYLFQSGDLMLLPRSGFQKVFELTERVLPSSLDTQMPDSKAMANYYVDFALNLWGIITRDEIAWKRPELTEGINDCLANRLEDGRLLKVEVEGLPKLEWWLRPESYEKALTTRFSSKAHILSPFDPLVINRKRLSRLFGFDFTIECYVPAEKRRFGYFALPILYRDQFIGLLDAKADRTNSTLLIRQLKLEPIPKPGSKAAQQIEATLTRAIKSFAALNSCHGYAGWPTMVD